jgi:Helicase associated domain
MSQDRLSSAMRLRLASRAAASSSSSSSLRVVRSSTSCLWCSRSSWSAAVAVGAPNPLRSKACWPSSSESPSSRSRIRWANRRLVSARLAFSASTERWLITVEAGDGCSTAPAEAWRTAACRVGVAVDERPMHSRASRSGGDADLGAVLVHVRQCLADALPAAFDVAPAGGAEWCFGGHRRLSPCRRPGMPRLMAVSLTEAAVVDRSKTVTRRMGWRHIKPGDRLTLCRKVMGRRRGEPLVHITDVEVVSVRQEPLNAITGADCAREGFPHNTPDEFIAFFCRTHRGCHPNSIVTRIEWGYIDAAAAAFGPATPGCRPQRAYASRASTSTYSRADSAIDGTSKCTRDNDREPSHTPRRDGLRDSICSSAASRASIDRSPRGIRHTDANDPVDKAATWDKTFGELELFACEHGHARPWRGTRLGEWCERQCRAYRSGMLAPERAQRLRSLPGWAWDLAEQRWLEQYSQVLDVASRSGGLALDDPSVAEVALRPREPRSRVCTVGRWWALQRQMARRKDLDGWRRAKLGEVLGSTWEALDPYDAEAVDLLGEYGHANPLADVIEDDVPLGQWLNGVRHRRATGHLRQSLLDEIAIVCPSDALDGALRWYWPETLWLLGFEALCQFAAREGRCRVPYSDDEKLPDMSISLLLGVWPGGRPFVLERTAARASLAPATLLAGGATQQALVSALLAGGPTQQALVSALLAGGATQQALVSASGMSSKCPLTCGFTASKQGIVAAGVPEVVRAVRVGPGCSAIGVVA